jgi:hypothetical protein
MGQSGGVASKAKERAPAVGSTISVRRGQGLSALLRRLKVFVDGELVARLKMDEVWTGVFEPGEHTVQVRLDTHRSEVISLEVGPSQAHQLECRTAQAGGRQWPDLAGDRYLRLYPVEADI